MKYHHNEIRKNNNEGKKKLTIYSHKIIQLGLRKCQGTLSVIPDVSAARSSLQKKHCSTKYLSTVILFCEVWQALSGSLGPAMDAKLCDM